MKLNQIDSNTIQIYGGIDYINTILCTLEYDMTNIQWLGTPESRILSIRKFRKYIDNLKFEDAVSLTQKNWESGPRVNKLHFNIAEVNDWPTPWDLFSQQTFCKNSQALGIFYTLIMSDHAKDHDIQLAVIDDVVRGECIALVVDNCYPHNWSISNMIKKEDVKVKMGVD